MESSCIVSLSVPSQHKHARPDDQDYFKLLFRTTRSIELTDSGRLLFEAAAPPYRDMIYAVKKTQEVGRSTKGTLRFSLSRGAYVTALAPILEIFLADNPGIALDILLNESLVDIIRDGFHAVIRLGDVLALDVMAVRLTPTLTPAFSAAFAYLERHARLKHPRDLFQHCCIRYKLPTANKLADWHFSEDGQDKTIDPPRRGWSSTP